MDGFGRVVPAALLFCLLGLGLAALTTIVCIASCHRDGLFSINAGPRRETHVRGVSLPLPFAGLRQVKRS